MTGSRFRALRLAGVLCAIAGIVAGCGSSSSSSSSTSSTSAPASTGTAAAAATTATASKCGAGTGKPATGAPIPVGAIVTQSGGVNFSSAANGANAFFACLNANGGIGGRPVQYAVKDDANNPQTSAADAASLVNDTKVVAMVGDQSFTDCLVNPKTYAQAGLMSVMGAGLQQVCFADPTIVPMNAGPRLSSIASAQVAQADGVKHLVLVVSNIPGFTAWVIQGVQAYSKAHGMQLVKVITVNPGVTGATSIAVELQAANPDGVLITAPLPDTVTILKAAQQQQLAQTAKFYCPTSCYDSATPRLIGSYWNGKLKANAEFQVVTATTPDASLWRESMQRYESGKPQDSFSEGGFLAAKLFSDALIKSGAPVTRASATKAIQAVSGYTTDLDCTPYTIGNAKAHNSKAVRGERLGRRRRLRDVGRGAGHDFPNHRRRELRLWRHWWGGCDGRVVSGFDGRARSARHRRMCRGRSRAVGRLRQSDRAPA